MKHVYYFLAIFLLSTSSISAQWQASPAPLGEDLEHIFFYNAQVGYTTSHGYIFKTINGGQTWTEKYYPGQLTGFEVYYFNEVYFLSISTEQGLVQTLKWVVMD